MQFASLDGNDLRAFDDNRLGSRGCRVVLFEPAIADVNSGSALEMKMVFPTGLIGELARANSDRDQLTCHLLDDHRVTDIAADCAVIDEDRAGDDAAIPGDVQTDAARATDEHIAKVRIRAERYEVDRGDGADGAPTRVGSDGKVFQIGIRLRPVLFLSRDHRRIVE